MLRARRHAVDTATRITAASAFAVHLEEIPEFQKSRHVAGYWAVQGELPLSVVVARIDRDPAKSFYLPRLAHDADHGLEFAEWRIGDAAAPNRFGIPEPAGDAYPTSALDMVLVPLVGFDRCGNRLGTGGGWYDRSFASRRESTAPPLLVGVGFACQEVSGIDSETWDVPMDWIVTEHEALRCAPAAVGAA